MSFGRVLETMVEVLHVKKMMCERMLGAANLLENSAYVRSVLSQGQAGLVADAKTVIQIFGSNTRAQDLGHCHCRNPH
jgi:hypothetical protein